MCYKCDRPISKLDRLGLCGLISIAIFVFLGILGLCCYGLIVNLFLFSTSPIYFLGYQLYGWSTFTIIIAFISLIVGGIVGTRIRTEHNEFLMELYKDG